MYVLLDKHIITELYYDACYSYKQLKKFEEYTLVVKIPIQTMYSKQALLLFIPMIHSFRTFVKLNHNNHRFVIRQKSKYNHSNQSKLIARSEGQKKYKQLLYNKDIDLIVCKGPAGTGKTSLACMYGIDLLESKQIEKIIITRPTITIEENLGYLPGDINSKMIPWTAPIFDIFLSYMSKSELDYKLKEKVIEVCPLGFIQGRTFKKSIIIADEMQNSSPTQMFMLLTRIGEESKMIINGDLHQNSNNNNGLRDLFDKLNSKYSDYLELYNQGISIVELSTEDIQRHKLISSILTIYNK